jgi:hypothetical protein
MGPSRGSFTILETVIERMVASGRRGPVSVTVPKIG